MMTMMTLAEEQKLLITRARVARGMDLLDAACSEWISNIDLAELQMRSCVCCVLGQQFPSFEDGLIELSLDPDNYESGEEYGFYSSGISEDWHRLQQVWEEAIGQRQRQAGETPQ